VSACKDTHIASTLARQQPGSDAEMCTSGGTCYALPRDDQGMCFRGDSRLCSVGSAVLCERSAAG
jgi:hypothetical protein